MNNLFSKLRPVKKYDIKDYVLDKKEEELFVEAFSRRIGIKCVHKITDNFNGIYTDMDNNFVKIRYNDKTYYFHVNENIDISFDKHVIGLRRTIEGDQRFISIYFNGIFMDRTGRWNNE